eukprot:3177979-Pyramimonas_sp.AAC.1
MPSPANAPPNISSSDAPTVTGILKLPRHFGPSMALGPQGIQIKIAFGTPRFSQLQEPSPHLDMDPRQTCAQGLWATKRPSAFERRTGRTWGVALPLEQKPSLHEHPEELIHQAPETAPQP